MRTSECYIISMVVKHKSFMHVPIILTHNTPLVTSYIISTITWLFLLVPTTIRLILILFLREDYHKIDY